MDAVEQEDFSKLSLEDRIQHKVCFVFLLFFVLVLIFFFILLELESPCQWL